MLCILQCKCAVDDNSTLAGNEEELTNHADIDIRISCVISDSEKFCLKRSFSCPSYYDAFNKYEKVVTSNRKAR